jgi:NitT/TauT family transport system ATP-binding protein
MNEELLRLQQEHGWTVVFVTHSVAEAVFLSSRIMVLAPHPGRISEIVSVALPPQRTGDVRASEAFEREVARVSQILRGAHAG